MIITKTPYRISLFGGGTDFPQWYRENGGQVISFTFDKYCYVTLASLPPFLGYKYLVSYSQIERVKQIEDIRHPLVRELLRRYAGNSHLGVSYMGDLPARSGVGSSSVFAVGLVHALRLLPKDLDISPRTLAHEAIEIEQNVLRENVGSQDQIAAAFGGFNVITFPGGKKAWSVESLQIGKNLSREIEDRCILVWSGIERFSSDINRGLIENMGASTKYLDRVLEITKYAKTLLEKGVDLDLIGSLLLESNALKKKSNPNASSVALDHLIEDGLKNGALGAKVLGAGGGGFILFWLRHDDKARFIRNWIRKESIVPVRIDCRGSRIVSTR